MRTGESIELRESLSITSDCTVGKINSKTKKQNSNKNSNSNDNCEYVTPLKNS